MSTRLQCIITVKYQIVRRAELFYCTFFLTENHTHLRFASVKITYNLAVKVSLDYETTHDSIAFQNGNKTIEFFLF